MLFHCHIVLHLPPTLPEEEKQSLLAAEVRRGAELMRTGTLRHIWRITGHTANISIWDAPNQAELTALHATLPLRTYLDIHVTPLSDHPVALAAATPA